MLTRQCGNTTSASKDAKMKNLTIVLDEAIATRAEAEAASRNKSLSEFVQELIEHEIGHAVESGGKTDLEVMREFLKGPGHPGISRNWRQELYDERLDELERRRQRNNPPNR
jgi:hypothetical protein